MSLVLLVLLNGCTTDKRRLGDQRVKPDGISQVYSKDGRLVREVSMKGGKRHGILKEFHLNGKTALQITYVENKKEGKAIRYYESGAVMQETDYVNDVAEGLQKKYYDNGQLMSEVRFNHGEPCLGLKEYTREGKLVTEYPEIKITTVDEVATTGRYYIQLRMSNGIRRVRFYEGTLSSDGCLGSSVIAIPMEKAGVGVITYHLPPGSFKMEELRIIARFETRLDNYHIVKTRHRVALDN